MKRNLLTNKTSGFTLLETIVAVTILMIAVIGPLSLASKGIVYADYVKDEITAYNLAQEAMESIRNIRDENIKQLPIGQWLQDLDKCISAPCRLDIWNKSGIRAGLCAKGDSCDTSGNSSTEDFQKMNLVNINGGPGHGTVTLYGYDFNSDILNGLNNAIVSPSIFIRKIIITRVAYTPPAVTQTEINNNNLGTPDEVNVKVEVDWRRIPSLPRSLVLSENLFSI